MAECPDCGCRFAARHALRTRAPVETDRRCEHCFEIFDTTESSKRRFCGRACQLAAYAERRRERVS